MFIGWLKLGMAVLLCLNGGRDGKALSVIEQLEHVSLSLRSTYFGVKSFLTFFLDGMLTTGQGEGSLYMAVVGDVFSGLCLDRL